MQNYSKTAKKTKTALVNTAWELFAKNGYEDTPINKVIEKLGLSKGAFYHYFSSKLDVLNEAVESICMKMIADIKKRIKGKDISATEKLNRFLSLSHSWGLSHIEIVKKVVPILYQNNNIVIRHKLLSRKIDLIAPILTQIITQGVSEGSFDVKYPAEAARIILHMDNSLVEMQMKSVMESKDFSLMLEEIERRANYGVDVLERILGVQEGSLERIPAKTLEGFALALRATD